MKAMKAKRLVSGRLARSVRKVAAPVGPQGSLADEGTAEAKRSEDPSQKIRSPSLLQFFKRKAPIQQGSLADKGIAKAKRKVQKKQKTSHKSETEAETEPVKRKKRLEKWKLYADRLGTEAPAPTMEVLPPSEDRLRRSKRRQRGKEEEAPPNTDAATGSTTKASRKNCQAMREASERAAEEALMAGDASLEAVQRALDLMELPASANRKNVIPKGRSEIQGLLFGLYSYGGTLGVSAATNAHPQLCKLLVSALRAVDCDFPFTSIQLNFNYASRPHVDKNNLGCSYIVGFGDYEGGELWVEDASAEEEPLSCTLDPDDDDVSALYRAGSSFLGRVEDIKGRWLQFDGNKLHYTRPFSGSRYTIIFFTCDQYLKVPEDVRCSLRSTGIEFNWESTDVEETLQQKLAEKARLRAELHAARTEEALQERMRRGRCIARIWADGWGHQCTAVCSEGKDMCCQHLKGQRWKTHGKFDGDLPPAKREEMANTQRKWLKQGKRPPPGEPWTKLVELP